MNLLAGDGIKRKERYDRKGAGTVVTSRVPVQVANEIAKAQRAQFRAQEN